MSPSRWMGIGLALAGLTSSVSAIDLDVTPQDVERALSIARGQDRDRLRFHAPYVQVLDSADVERVEVVSELRRIVLTAEDRLLKGDRAFGYSVTLAEQANAPWKRRVSVVARLRFHPHNTYVSVPPADILAEGAGTDVIGVLNEPILTLSSGEPGDRQPIYGAIVEAVFEAASLGQRRRTFVVRLEGRELARVEFDLSAID